MSNLEEAREYFEKDLYASQQTGIVIEAAEAGEYRIEIVLSEDIPAGLPGHYIAMTYY